MTTPLRSLVVGDVVRIDSSGRAGRVVSGLVRNSVTVQHRPGSTTRAAHVTLIRSAELERALGEVARAERAVLADGGPARARGHIGHALRHLAAAVLRDADGPAALDEVRRRLSRIPLH